MAVMAPLRVEVSEPDALYGGLLNVAASLGILHDVADPHIGMGAEWESPICGNPGFAPGVCDDALAINPATLKTFGGIGRNESKPFGIYKGLECDLFRDDYEDLARTALALGESWAVERAVQNLILTNSPTVVAAGGYSLTDAIAVMEDYIAGQGAGRGLLHTGRFGAAWLASTRGVKTDQDFHLWTAQGTPIVNGGGYQRGTGTTKSQFWLYATGSLNIFRSDVIYTEAPALARNKKDAIAERLYTAGADCFVASILVDPSLTTIGA